MNELVRLFFELRERGFLAKHLELLTTNLYREDQVRLAVSDVSVDFGARTSENFFSAFYTAEADGMGVGLAVRRSKVGALLSFLVGFLPSTAVSGTSKDTSLLLVHGKDDRTIPSEWLLR